MGMLSQLFFRSEKKEHKKAGQHDLTEERHEDY
jgi:hypothetical protein